MVKKEKKVFESTSEVQIIKPSEFNEDKTIVFTSKKENKSPER